MAAIVETGGVVCTWPYGFDSNTFDRVTFADWVEEIRVFKSHFGIRFIGLGTDSGGGLPGYVDEDIVGTTMFSCFTGRMRGANN
jgi:microsomal dipeptidase-like Zn-dependent dipeptidase